MKPDEITTVRLARMAGRSPILPSRQSEQAAGFDLCADLDAPLVLVPGARAAVATGWMLALPPGFEAQVRPRSGLALRHGLTCLNTPGTIDSDYRGEVKVILANLGGEAVTIRSGERIAQLVIQRLPTVSLMECAVLDNTARGDGGFGSTGR